MKTVNLIPYPYEYTEKNGICKFTDSTICVLGDIEKEFLKSLNEYLINCDLQFDFIENPGRSPYVQAVLITETVYESYKLENPESYLLRVEKDCVLICASSQQGLFYGFISFVQLLMNEKSITCCEIFDKPQYEWRGFMLDTCRTFYSTSFIKKIIRLCAFHKMNKFHWHLTDDQGWRINVEEYPLLTKIGSVRKANTNPPSNVGDYDGTKFERYYYTDEDIREVIEYANKYNVEIIPEIEFPGHSSALLAAYPEFGCTHGPYSVETRFGIFDDVLCLGNDKIFDLYKAILSKVTKLFPSKYIHIGGDECPVTRWKECPECQKRIRNFNLKNESELQSWGTQKITELVVSFGKRPVGWDEVLDNTDKIPLSDKVVVQSWRGTEGGERASAQNHKVIMSPVDFCYLDHKTFASVEEPGRLGTVTLEKSYEFNPVTQNMSKKASEYVLGGEATLFTEEVPYSRIAEYLILPRLCSLAECMWLSQEKKEWGRFSSLINDHKSKLNKLGFISS